MPNTISFMGVRFHLCTRQEVVAAIASASATNPVRIATLNPEFMVEAQHNPAFREALASMTHTTIDGSGLFFALKLRKFFGKLPHPIEQYYGSDLIEDLFRRHQFGDKRFFFLGGQGFAQTASAVLKQRYPQIKIVGAKDGGEINPQNVQIEPSLIEEITTSKADILIVGFGAPKQELWIQEAATSLPTPVMIGIGGSLGFYGTKSRAPKILRTLHLEWLYRGLTEKGHARRVVRATVTFPLLFLRWSFSNKSERGKVRT